MHAQESTSHKVKIWSTSFKISKIEKQTIDVQAGEIAQVQEFWEIIWEPGKLRIVIEVASGIELATVIEAIGSGKLSPTTESLEDFFARGGTITKCPPRFAVGARHEQNIYTQPLPPVSKRENTTSALRKEEIKNLTVEQLFPELFQ